MGFIAVLIWPFFPYAWRWRIVTCWNRFVMFWLRICCNIRFEIVGHKHPEAFPCVIMAKHQSTWETMFLQYYFGPVSTILKDRKSTRLNSSHVKISYAVFCLKKKNK